MRSRSARRLELGRGGTSGTVCQLDHDHHSLVDREPDDGSDKSNDGDSLHDVDGFHEHLDGFPDDGDRYEHGSGRRG
jgi:hypothetical protein